MRTTTGKAMTDITFFWPIYPGRAEKQHKVNCKRGDMWEWVVSVDGRVICQHEGSLKRAKELAVIHINKLRDNT